MGDSLLDSLDTHLSRGQDATDIVPDQKLLPVSYKPDDVLEHVEKQNSPLGAGCLLAMGISPSLPHPMVRPSPRAGVDTLGLRSRERLCLLALCLDNWICNWQSDLNYHLY